MNDFARDESKPEPINFPRQPWLDRLVDGELDGDTRRALIARTGERARRLAPLCIGISRAQCFAEGMRSIAREGEFVDSLSAVRLASAGHATVEPSTGRYASFRLVLAMAASFFLAFGLGISLRGIGVSPRDGLAKRDSASHNIARHDRAPDDIADRVELNDNGSQIAMGDGVGRTTESASGDDPEDDSLADAVWLPANSAEDDVLWGGQTPTALPENVVRNLRRHGHRVDQQRKLWPVRLEDGSRALMPVDRVQVHYVGQQYE